MGILKEMLKLKEVEYSNILKEELIQIHYTLFLVKDLFEKAGISNGHFESYEQANIFPTYIHRTKWDHERAILILANGIQEIFDGFYHEKGEEMKVVLAKPKIWNFRIVDGLNGRINWIGEEEEMSRIVRVVKTRKTHICGACNCEIPKGELAFCVSILNSYQKHPRIGYYHYKEVENFEEMSWNDIRGEICLQREDIEELAERTERKYRDSV